MNLPAFASQIRGIGTLSRIVGPNTERLAAIIENHRDGNAKDEVTESEKYAIRCPVCSCAFENGQSEAEMSEHVEICLHRKQGMDRRTSDAAAHDSEPVQVIELCDDEEDIRASLGEGEFDSCIVGRRYGNGSSVLKDEKCVLFWEPNNPCDENAVLVKRSMDYLGHLPRVVAAYVGPLLRENKVEGHGCIMKDSIGYEQVPVRFKLNFKEQVVDRESIVERVRQISYEHLNNVPASSGRMLNRLYEMFTTVESIESKALGEDEHNFMNLFRSQTPACQIVFMKLCQRSKSFYAINKTQLNETTDIKSCVDQLVRSGLFNTVDPRKNCSAEKKQAILSDVFRVKDLKQLISDYSARALGGPKCPSPTKMRSMKRENLISYVLKKMEDQPPIFSTTYTPMVEIILDSCGGTIFEISAVHARSFLRIQRLFFLNEGHYLSMWHATESGCLSYPKYSITRKTSVFGGQKLFQKYELSLVHAHKLLNAVQQKNDAEIDKWLEPAWNMLDSKENKVIDYPRTPLPFFLQYNSKWVYSVMATVGISFLEKRKQYRSAIDRLQQLLGGVYCTERRGYWWIRLSVDLEHLGKGFAMDALEIAETALADTSIRLDERLTLQRRILKLGKPPRRWKKPAWVHTMPKEPKTIYILNNSLDNTRGGKSKFIGYDSSVCTVEELALQYYATEEGGSYRGIHSEGGIWCTLFTLLLWPALFQPVPDAFRTRFQTAPLDLGYPGFYESRKDVIDKILEDVKSGNGNALLEQSWNSHYGVTVRGVSWRKHDLSTLRSIISCIGGPGIAAVCNLLCQDYSNWTAGMPDLLLWRESTRTAKLSEVKGPRDQLSDKQRAWIGYLSDSGIPCEVLRVKEPKLKRLRS